MKCAQSVGLKAKIVQLGWDDLTNLGKALPAIVRLKSGDSMVLLRIEGEPDNACAVLQDPLAEEDQVLPLDRIRFEEAWTREVVLIKRDYEITDEKQPFSLGLIAALVFRERWIVRDVAICAFILGVLALSPIIFWRVMSDRVIHYQAFNTFYVVCLGFLLLLAFEVVFFWLRRYLLLHLTTRIDVKLSTYVFDKVLNLPMDFFERTPVGKITHDVQQLWKIRTFLTGQLFGTILDSTTLLVFLPLMFFFSPHHDSGGAGVLRPHRAVAHLDAAELPPEIEQRGRKPRRRVAQPWCRPFMAYERSNRFRSMRDNGSNGTCTSLMLPRCVSPKA